MEKPGKDWMRQNHQEPPGPLLAKLTANARDRPMRNLQRSAREALNPFLSLLQFPGPRERFCSGGSLDP